MPTYDYQCKACDHRFEVFESITAEPRRKCPECGKRKLHRLIGPCAAIVFKGSGFYTTDYRSESYRKGAAAESGNGTSGAAAGGTSGPDGQAKGKAAGKSKASDAPAATP